MGPPWASGVGVVLVLGAILSLIFFPAGLIIVGLAAAALVIALAIGGGAASDDEPTPRDPVTGGARWWQKRWDE